MFALFALINLTSYSADCLLKVMCPFGASKSGGLVLIHHGVLSVMCESDVSSTKDNTKGFPLWQELEGVTYITSSDISLTIKVW